MAAPQASLFLLEVSFSNTEYLVHDFHRNCCSQNGCDDSSTRIVCCSHDKVHLSLLAKEINAIDDVVKSMDYLEREDYVSDVEKHLQITYKLPKLDLSGYTWGERTVISATVVDVPFLNLEDIDKKEWLIPRIKTGENVDDVIHDIAASPEETASLYSKFLEHVMERYYGVCWSHCGDDEMMKIAVKDLVESFHMSGDTKAKVWFSLVDNFARNVIEDEEDDVPFDEIGKCWFPDDVAEVCRQQVIVHLREFVKTNPESAQLFMKDLNMSEEMMALVDN